MRRVNILLTRKKIYIIIILGLISLAALNLISWIFLQSLKKDLITELKNQILYIGQVTSRLIKGDDLERIVPGMENSQLVLYYQQLLYDIKINNELENIVLLDPTGYLLIDFRLNYIIKDTLFAFPIQSNLVKKASLGETPDPFLIKSDDQYFLSAYLPILNDYEEPVAILVMDAPLKFFSTLIKFEVGILYLGIGGIFILITFSLIIMISTKRLFAAEDRMKEQDRLVQLGQMVATVAHEIRNPLSIIKGTAEVLKKKYENLDDEMFSYIPTEIERLNQLVNQFLQFSRRSKLEMQQYDLNKKLNELIPNLEDHRLEIENIGSIPLIKVDSNALKQVLLNVINNAFDSIDTDGKVTIRFFTEGRRNRMVVIEVRDNGKGIKKEDLPKVFEPFYSTKASGSGLGLAISRQLIEQMGGKIQIDSQKETGTTVWIKLKST